MKKIYLEFEEGTSIQEIKEEMMYYQSRNQPVVTTINGEEVHSDAHNIEDIFERLSLGLTEEEYNQYKEQQYTLKKITDILDNLKRDSANLLDIQATLSTVFSIVETYGQKGEYLQRVFFSDSTLELQRAISIEKAETESQIKNLTFPKGK